MAKPKMLDSTTSYKGWYSRYEDTALIERLKLYALWTLPSVFPNGDSVENGNAVIEHDYQSIGALLVNRLASRLTSTLFPVDSSFFRIEPNDGIKQTLDSKGIKSLIEYENKACRRLLYKASYAQLVQALRLLIITGECLLLRKDNRVSVFSLKNYVLKRNNIGEVQDIIIREVKLYSELDSATQSLIGSRTDDEELELYTRVQKQVIQGVVSWKVTQEIEDKRLSGYEIYRDKLCPYIPVTWSIINGDSYGRGYVEEYAGDLSKVSELSQALTEYELLSCDVYHVFNPQGNFDIDAAVNAKSGDWIQGNKEAVTPYEIGSYQKIQELRNDIQAIEVRLNTAFMYTGNTREGERVTAYEISRNAEEAEQVLGGVYSQLSQNMHLPLAYLLLYEVRSDIINALDAEDIELNILTGLQALSRSSQNQSLLIAANEINAIVTVFANFKEYKIPALIESILLSNGIDPSDFKYTEEELVAMQQQEQQQAQAQQQQLMQQQAIQQQGAQLQATQAVQSASGFE